MIPGLLLLAACSLLGGKDKGGQNGGDDTASETPPPPEPIEVADWSSNVAIAGDEGVSQGEPSAIALPDGTIWAAWMETQDDYGLYVTLSSSADSGKTWTTPFQADPDDRWAWQNDPAFAYADGRLLFTWLAVESSNGSKSAVYCVESDDGGETWGDKVKLSTESNSVDRQWMASSGDRVVITWDSFGSGYSESQVYAESTSGCSGFSEPSTIVDGIFLNGNPVIDTDGNVWASRNEFGRRSITHIVSELTDSGWVDTLVQEYEYPNGSAYAMFADREEDADAGRFHGFEEEDFKDILGDLNLSRVHYELANGLVDPEEIRATAKGTYDGEYSPVLAALPTGGIGIATLATEESDADYADVSYFTLVDGVLTDKGVVNGDDGSISQMEPWLAVDVAGGVHVTWYDAREDDWRLYSATSTNGGDDWTETPVGDELFSKGFAENTYADTIAWVGHFQGLVTTEDEVIAIFGDSHTSNVSRIYAAHSK